MKKLFALALVVLGFAACQTEPEFDVNMGDGTTTISVVLPEDAVTRAGENGENDSALGGLDNTTGETVRVIFEVYYNDKTNADLRQVKYLADGELQTNFDVRLVPGRNYTFVAWADMVDGVDAGDKYYNTKDLKAVTMMPGTWNAMVEQRDAYTATKLVENFQSTSTIELKLVRPFAKLRVVTTDMAQLNDLGIVPTTATVSYSSKHYTTFNAYAGVAEKKENSGVAHTQYTVDVYDENWEDDANLTLYADYFFAAEDVVNFSMNVYDQNGIEIGAAKSFTTDIPVKRNNLTTIIGTVLTEANNIKVEVTPAFEAEYIYLQGDVTLTEDLVLDRPLMVRPGESATINLNGNDIINTTKSETFGEGEGIIAYGELNIIGEGTVQGSTMAVWARGNAGAVVNIYGGTFLGCEEDFAKGGRSVVYASSGNVVNIYGGKVQALAADKASYANKTEGVYAALNVADRNGMINVYGGSFYKQNPAAPGTEPADWNATHPNGFLAEGYASVANGEWFDVVSKDSLAIDDVDAFKDALANGQETIVLKGGVEFEGVFEINKPVEIISYATEKPIIKGRVIITANCRIENVKFAINDTTKKQLGKMPNGINYAPFNGGSNYQYKAIVYPFCASTTFVGCEFESDINSSVCAINFGDAHAEHKLTVENSKFTGNFYPIRSRINFSVKNCEFNSSYNGDGLAAVFCFGMADEVGTIVFTDNTATTPNNKIFLGAYFYANNHAYNAYITTSNNQGFYENGFSYAEGRVTMGDVYLNGNKL